MLPRKSGQIKFIVVNTITEKNIFLCRPAVVYYFFSILIYKIVLLIILGY